MHQLSQRAIDEPYVSVPYLGWQKKVQAESWQGKCLTSTSTVGLIQT